MASSATTPAAAAVDRFYTKPAVARRCWRTLAAALPELTSRRIADLFFVEPSAGAGVFYDLLPPSNRIGVDIMPRRADIIRRDFLAWDYLPRRRQDVVVVGNPPFGKRGALAVRFVNHAATLADTVAFILPVSFRKYLIHKQLDSDLRLMRAAPLPRASFCTERQADYAVNTEFQIWTRLPAGAVADRRLYAPPPVAHPDFEMWQYNNTPQMLKVFANPFDFAVPCQGWQDYGRRETDAARCEKQKQWVLFAAPAARVRARLRRMDFAALAMRCGTATPGFRKSDIVAEYTRLTARA